MYIPALLKMCYLIPVWSIPFSYYLLIVYYVSAYFLLFSSPPEHIIHFCHPTMILPSCHSHNIALTSHSLILCTLCFCHSSSPTVNIVLSSPIYIFNASILHLLILLSPIHKYHMVCIFSFSPVHLHLLLSLTTSILACYIPSFFSFQCCNSLTDNYFVI